MTFRLPRIYPITDTSISRLSHAEQVRRLAAGGATIVQLREKTMRARDFYVEAKTAVAVARETGVQVIINDRVDIALAVAADGVHLGQEDMPVEVARRLLGPRSIIGFSTHNLNQAKDALNLPVDYLAVGPIFATKTKENPDPELGLAGLSYIAGLVGTQPLVAIGGITQSNAREVCAAGATSLALISFLLSDPEAITERTAALFTALH
jgi:thiamine-phosphate pyrophosphorylase